MLSKNKFKRAILWHAIKWLSWTKPNSCGVKDVDNYMLGINNLYSKVSKAIKNEVPSYTIHTYYLETEAMQICKAVKLFSTRTSSRGKHNDLRIPVISLSLNTLNLKQILVIL